MYPALAVLQFLKTDTNNGDFFWMGSKKGLEYPAVTSAGVRFHSVPAGKLRRYFSLSNFIDLFRIAGSFFASMVILMKHRPDAMFSKGGFVSVPPVWAAALLRIPVVSHESDLHPGLATRLNAPFSKTVCVGYDVTAAVMGPKYRDRTVVTGNPVRKEVFEANPERGIAALGLTESERAKPLIMVIGGSQGAKAVNEMITRNIKELSSAYTIVHQTGDAHADKHSRSESYYPKGFFKDEHLDLIAAADLVIGRSGAGTLWECACIGTPMLLIPLSTGSSRGDQIQNARYFEEAGAARILMEEHGSDFLETVQGIMSDGGGLSAMSTALKRIAKHDAAALIGRIILDLVRGGSR